MCVCVCACVCVCVCVHLSQCVITLHDILEIINSHDNL